MPILIPSSTQNPMCTFERSPCVGGYSAVRGDSKHIFRVKFGVKSPQATVGFP